MLWEARLTHATRVAIASQTGSFPGRRCKISGHNRRDDAEIADHSTDRFPVPRGTSRRENLETRCTTEEVTHDQSATNACPEQDEHRHGYGNGSDGPINRSPSRTRSEEPEDRSVFLTHDLVNALRNAVRPVSGRETSTRGGKHGDTPPSRATAVYSRSTKIQKLRTS